MKHTRWTDDQIILESKKFSGKSKLEFRNGNPKAYRAAIRRNLLEKMTWLSGRRTWTDDDVIEESKKYAGKGRSSFKRGSPAAWDVAYRRGLVNKMTWLGENNHHYWSWEELVEASKPYAGKGRKAFACGCPKAYRFALREGLLDKLTWLGEKSSPYTDPMWSVYVYKFPAACYVGLTIDTSIRDLEHRTNHHGGSSVFKYHEKTCIPIPRMTVIANGLTKEQARVMEDSVRKSYERIPGMTVLNIARTGKDSGSTGSVSRLWTRPRIEEVAKRCKCRSELKKKYHSAYTRARKLGMLEALFPQKARRTKE